MEKLSRLKGFSQRHFNNILICDAVKDHIPFDLPYHRSAVNLSLIKKDVKAFYNPKTEMPNCDFLKLAICKVRRDFHLSEPVKMIHLNDVFNINDLNIWDSSPGLPWKECGYRTKRDIKRDPEAIRRIRKFWHLVKSGKQLNPPDSLAYVRSHLAPLGEEKVRAVWGYPATMTFGEAVFALPLIRGYKEKHHSPIGYGYETAIGGFKKLLFRFGSRPYFQTMDFKSFDKTVPAWLIEVAFDILLDNLNIQDYQDYGLASARKMLNMWRYIINYFINTPIRLCNGERYRKRSGVASGSYFTQLIDSVVNAILINWVHIKITDQFPYDYLVMGDDSLAASRGYLDYDEVQDLLDGIGMNINFKKSAQSKYLNRLSFIGYQINYGIPTKPIEELYAALAFPERPDRCVEDLQNRALGLIYAALGQDSHFHALCTKIVQFKSFDIIIPRHLMRMITLVLGLDIRSTTPPTEMELLKRLL